MKTVLARTILKATESIIVSDFHQTNAKEGIIVYEKKMEDGATVHVTDQYTIDQSVIETLLLVPAGKKVSATIYPGAPGWNDLPGQPNCSGACVME